MLTDKPTLTLDEVDAQFATELPQRDTMLVTIVIGNLLSGNTVDVTLRNIDVAVQVCAQVLDVQSNLTCEVQQ